MVGTDVVTQNNQALCKIIDLLAVCKSTRFSPQQRSSVSTDVDLYTTSNSFHLHGTFNVANSIRMFQRSTSNKGWNLGRNWKFHQRRHFSAMGLSRLYYELIWVNRVRIQPWFWWMQSRPCASSCSHYFFHHESEVERQRENVGFYS